MEVNYKIGDNGKPKVSFIQNHTGITQFNRIKNENFKCDKTTLFLTEVKINNPKLRKDDRDFILSLRQEGNKDGINEYKQAQIGLDKEELILIRNNINKMLNDTNQKPKDKNELWGCGKKYKIRYCYGGSYDESMLQGAKIQSAIGVLVGYDRPWVGRIFLETENGGIEIIPMKSIVDMREII